MYDVQERIYMKLPVRRTNYKHGLSVNGIKHPIYKMKERIIYYCYRLKENHPAYSCYKGKGIKMCDGWRYDTKLFYNWCIENGWKKGMQIDRIDSNGDYCPENCQFLTLSEHCRKSYDEMRRRYPRPTNAKLTENHVKVIRMLRELGYSYQKIASFFGIGKTTTISIVAKQTWKDVIIDK